MKQNRPPRLAVIRTFTAAEDYNDIPAIDRARLRPIDKALRVLDDWLVEWLTGHGADGECDLCRCFHKLQARVDAAFNLVEQCRPDSRSRAHRQEHSTAVNG